jgi:hypothetical protein
MNLALLLPSFPPTVRLNQAIDSYGGGVDGRGPPKAGSNWNMFPTSGSVNHPATLGGRRMSEKKNIIWDTDDYNEARTIRGFIRWIHDKGLTLEGTVDSDIERMITMYIEGRGQ